jgi:uncharacterized protein
MTDQPLSEEERQLLLNLARQTIDRVTRGGLLPEIDLAELPPRLAEPGVCFVTLTTRSGALRGCIGALEVRLPLALDVCQHAAAAALEDYRFVPVRPEEVDDLQIEISRLTPPQPLHYQTPDELLQCLRPMQDGVVLHDGPRRATFLPQVWEKIPDPVVFLSNLCHKMGASSDLWKRKPLVVEIYQVEEFHE